MNGVKILENKTDGQFASKGLLGTGTKKMQIVERNCESVQDVILQTVHLMPCPFPTIACDFYTHSFKDVLSVSSAPGIMLRTRHIREEKNEHKLS